jgi:hypothetical protein
VIWLALTSLLATFVGAMTAAKGAGSPDERIGALHGLTLWAASTVTFVLLGAMGVGGAVTGISKAVSSGITAGSSVLQGLSPGGEPGGLPASVTDGVAAALKHQMARMTSETAAGSNVQRSEVSAAIDELTTEDGAAIASALASGEPDVARDRLANTTSLSEQEIDSIVRGAEQQVESWSGSEAAQDAEQWLREQVGRLRGATAGAVSEMGGAEVSRGEAQRAMRQLDADTLTRAAGYLISGEPERAQDVLAMRTNLSEGEIDDIVEGAEREVQEMVEEAKAEVNEATEAIASYSQAVLWAAFAASALGLAAGLFGGYLGAGTVRYMYGVDTSAY